ncbi:MAG TPA: LysM domain-containing protein [Ilumatobacter sp.]|nr:LysM domain-containing protein [Ilumatobacter sp.]
MRRLTVLPALSCLLLVVVASCGDEGGAALDTLPPIRTTTTEAPTTTIPPDLRRIFYVVQAGDNLNDIATRYQVTVKSIVDLNNLPEGGGMLQIGQEIEIPNDLRIDATLPPLPDETGSTLDVTTTTP